MYSRNSLHRHVYSITGHMSSVGVILHAVWAFDIADFDGVTKLVFTASYPIAASNHSVSCAEIVPGEGMNGGKR